MNEIGKFEVQKKKLQGLCDEHNLVYKFCKDKYPITLTIKTTGGLDGQMTMLENAEEEGYRSPDARLVFLYKDGAVDFHFSEKFTISDALFSKLKNLFKNMHALWLQYFFRDLVERGALTERQMPQIDDDDDDELPDGAEPLESFDDDELPDVDLPDDEDSDDEGDAEAAPVDAADPLVVEATRIIRHENKATVSLLQRHMQIGYAKASRLMDALEQIGVVGPFNGSDPREVLPHDEPGDEAAGDEEGADDADEA